MTEILLVGGSLLYPSDLTDFFLPDCWYSSHMIWIWTRKKLKHDMDLAPLTTCKFCLNLLVLFCIYLWVLFLIKVEKFKVLSFWNIPSLLEGRLYKFVLIFLFLPPPPPQTKLSPLGLLVFLWKTETLIMRVSSQIRTRNVFVCY